MTATDPQPTAPAADVKRSYVAPSLVVHGDVRTLTLKTGPSHDVDGGGSFIHEGTG